MINFAIYGPGNISHRVMEGMKHVKGAKVTAFCTRNPEKVREYGLSYGVEKFLSHQQLMDDEDIQAIYITTPHYLHYQLIRDCLLAGKHVICEKPVTITPEEIHELHEIADEKGLMLMEAQKALFVPVFTEMKQWINSGKIGKVYLAEADFSRRHDLDPDSWQLTKPGAGTLYDVGCYCLSELFGLFPQKHRDISVSSIRHNNVPVSSVVKIETADGPTLVATASHAVNGNCDLRIYGDEGSIICHEFWKSHDCTLKNADGEQTLHFDFPSEFTFEIQHFVDCINQHKTHSEINTPQISETVIRILYENR